MGNIFTGSEIVELAVQIEKNGRDFYNTLVKRYKDSKIQEILTFLAQEEERHISVFQKILDDVGKYTPAESYSGEYIAYMNSLASEYIFTKEKMGEATAVKAKTELQAIELGIGFEKYSITVYEGMKKVVPNYDQKTIDEVILQEEGHLKKLSDLKKSLY